MLAGAGVGMPPSPAASRSGVLAFPGQPVKRSCPGSTSPPPNTAPDVVGTQLVWEQLDSWITPNDKFFTVHHYPVPTIAADGWALKIDGLVKKPLSLTLNDLRARPRQEVTFTLECSGNHGFPWLTGAVGNATWAGTPLAPILREAGITDQGIEVAFFGGDTGEEAVRDAKVIEQFARSMSVADAMDPNLILCYEMNGAPLPVDARRPGAADRAGLVRGGERQVAGAHPGAADALRGAVHGPRLRDDAHGAARRRHA